MKTLNNLRIKTCIIILLLISNSIAFATSLEIKGAPYVGNTIASGDWMTGSNWSLGYAPDPSSDQCTLTFNQNITYTSATSWTWTKTVTITIESNVIVTINADLAINNNFTLIVKPGGQFIVNGDLSTGNNVDVTLNGTIYVTGDLVIQGGGGSGFDGTGELIVDGTIDAPTGLIPDSFISDIARWLVVDNGNWNINTSWARDEDGTKIASTPPNHQCIVYIKSGYTGLMNIDDTISQLEIYAGGSLNILAGKTLAVLGDINSSGSILINSDASGTGGLIYNGSNAVTATCERYVTAGEYHYVSSPMTSAPVSSYNITSGGYTNPNFYRYNEASSNPDWMYGWVPVTSGNLTPGVGYAFYTDENYAYSLAGGTLINGTYNVPITNTVGAGGGKSWNLIGNPYPCNLNADAFIDANDDGTVFTGSLYFWDDDGTGGTDFSSADYLVYTKGGGTSGGNGSTLNGRIAPLQSFFVQANTGGNLVFNSTMKTVSQALFLKNIEPIDLPSGFKMLRLSVKNTENVYNQILIKFADDAETERDIYDGFKLKGNPHLAFYSLLNDEAYAIQGFPTGSMIDLDVKLGLDANLNSYYTITAEEYIAISNSIDIFLEDLYLGKVVNLRNQDYSFEAFGMQPDRFILHFNQKNLNGFSGIDDIQNNINVYSNNKTLYVNGINSRAKLFLYDITGKLVYENDISESSNSIPLNLPNGYYVANIILNDKVETFKVYLD